MERTFPSSENCVPVLTRGHHCFVKDNAEDWMMTFKQAALPESPLFARQFGTWGKVCGHVDKGQALMNVQNIFWTFRTRYLLTAKCGTQQITLLSNFIAVFSREMSTRLPL